MSVTVVLAASQVRAYRLGRRWGIDPSRIIWAESAAEVAGLPRPGDTVLVDWTFERHSDARALADWAAHAVLAGERVKARRTQLARAAVGH